MDILLVVFEVIKSKNLKLEHITEIQQEQELRKFIAQLKFSENLSGKLFEESTRQFIDNQKEKYLYAYVHLKMQDADFMNPQDLASKNLLLCGFNIVNCVAHAEYT